MAVVHRVAGRRGPANCCPDSVRELDVIEALGDEAKGYRAEGRVRQLDHNENWRRPHWLGDHCAVLRERRNPD